MSIQENLIFEINNLAILYLLQNANDICLNTKSVILKRLFFNDIKFGDIEV